jgi:hypothetical protein
MNFISGGYYFSQCTHPPEWANLVLLPEKLWSPSPIFSELFPDSWIFSWGKDRKDRNKSELMKIIGLDNEEFTNMQAFFDALEQQNRIGFPNIIYDLSLARNLYQKYFWRIPNLKLLSVGLPETYLDEFVEDMKFPSQYFKSSLRKKILQNEILPVGGNRLGFDILGFGGAVFWPFITNGFETKFFQDLGINLNSFGLIDQYEDAMKALKYVRSNRHEEGSWYLWLEMEYQPFFS